MLFIISIVVTTNICYPLDSYADTSIKDLLGDIVNKAKIAKDKKATNGQPSNVDTNSNTNSIDAKTVPKKAEASVEADGNVQNNESIFDKSVTTNPEAGIAGATFQVCAEERTFSDQINGNKLPLYHECCAKADAFLNFIHSKEGRIKELLTEQQLNMYMTSYPKLIADEQRKDPAFGKSSITLWQELTKSPEWQFWYPTNQSGKRKDVAISSYSLNKQFVPACVMANQEEVKEFNSIHEAMNKNNDVHTISKLRHDKDTFNKKWLASHKDKYQNIKLTIKFADNLNDLPNYYTP
jgi:hypothetical protein